MIIDEDGGGSRGGGSAGGSAGGGSQEGILSVNVGLDCHIAPNDAVYTYILDGLACKLVMRELKIVILFHDKVLQRWNELLINFFDTIDF